MTMIEIPTAIHRADDDLPWVEANNRLESQPTVNIEGLVGGYTGPGGKTIRAKIVKSSAPSTRVVPRRY